MRLFTFLLGIVLVCDCGGQTKRAQAQAAGGIIVGRVLDPGGDPVYPANVVIDQSTLGTTTQADGTFRIEGLKAGPYNLSVSALGFQSQERNVEVRANRTTRIEVTVNTGIERLDEVIVTASRRAESISEVPSAVTIVGREQVQQQMAMNTDITNLLQYTVPGLSVATGRTSNTGQTLRGRQVLVLVDGVPQSTPLRNGGRDLRIIDPSAIERIEIIKGATSIYGNGADGGIINYITKKPTGDRLLNSQTWAGFTAGLTGDNRETQGYRLSQQLSGRSNKFDYVLNGTYERTGLFRDSDGVVLSPFYSPAEMNHYNVLAKVGYTFSDKQRVEAMYNYFSAKSDLQYVRQIGAYGQTPTTGVFSPDRVPGSPEGTPYNHNATVRYTHDQLIGSTGLSVVGYAQSFRTVYGYDDRYFEGGGQSNIVSDKKGVRLDLNTPFALGSKANGELLYGVDLLNDRTAQKLQDGRFWTPDMNMTNLAPYGQVKVDLFDRLIFKAGARFENIGVEVSDFNTLRTYNNATKGYDGGIAVTGGTLNYHAFVGNVGLRYAGSPAFQPFVSFSQAFSINELGRILRTSQTSIIGDLRTEPVIVDNYEAGVAGTVGRIFHYDVAYYQSFSELGASYRQLPSGVFEIARNPERVSGFEVAADVTPLSFVSFGGSYSYVEGKTDSDDDGSYDEYLGGDRIMAPKTTFYVRLRPVPALVLNLNTLTLGNRDRFSPNANGRYSYGRGPVESFTLLNFTGSFAVNSDFNVSVGVENLLNADYFPAISQWAARDADYVRGAGRRGMLTLSYKL